MFRLSLGSSFVPSLFVHFSSRPCVVTPSFLPPSLSPKRPTFLCATFLLSCILLPLLFAPSSLVFFKFFFVSYLQFLLESFLHSVLPLFPCVLPPVFPYSNHFILFSCSCPTSPAFLYPFLFPFLSFLYRDLPPSMCPSVLNFLPGVTSLPHGFSSPLFHLVPRCLLPCFVTYLSLFFVSFFHSILHMVFQ
ncbi:hypothetical protein AMECASPLE_035231 [Ameca splendens]|uniref:Uncharacterized protein n=1 Tax=Ameca splendens TaxID=208324 RepID=A0ABV0XW83_9TELE